MIKLREAGLEGVKLIENVCSRDSRGSFIKVYNDADFAGVGLDVDLREIYYSVSQKDVIRGMHFQLPPHEHAKIVHVISGSVMDVVVDLRTNSPTFKKHMSILLSDREAVSLYIPKGFAHGFKSLEDNTVMLYQVTSGYQPQYDSGIAYDSIGYDWGTNAPILSDRDRRFVALEGFESPF